MTALRIGIPIVGGRHWMAGVTYVEMLARSAGTLPPARRPDLFLVLRPETLEDMEYHLPFLRLFKGVILWIPAGIDPAPFRRESFAVCAGEQELFARIDFFYPVISDAWEKWCSASWIPDFQHHFLPEFFSGEEIASRNAAFAKVAEKARMLVLSSETVRRDFRRFHPHSRAATRVLSFFSYVGGEAFGRDARATADAYGLPPRFLLCCNQFWMHKDHGTLFRALAELRAEGEDIPLVCTGSTSDYRASRYFPELEASLKRLGVAGQVRILGMIPRGEQVQLMRLCCALVQPSLFEGWSSIVEDAKTLGKPIFLSDLDVHREQAPAEGFFFKAGDAGSLARAIRTHYPGLSAGPDRAREAKAQARMAERMESFGEAFLETAEAAVGLYSGSARPGAPGTSLEDGLAAAEAAHRAGRGQEALELLEELLRRWPGNARVLNDLGVVMHAHGERQLAIDCFRGAAEADPDYPDPVANLDEIFAGSAPSLAAPSAPISDSSEPAGKATSSDPSPLERNDADALRAEATLRAGHADEAARILETLLQRDPGHVRALNNLGMIRLQQGRGEEGLGILHRAVRADRGHYDSLVNLLQALVQSGRHQEALEAGYASLDLRPDDPTLLVAVAAVEEDWSDLMLSRSFVRNLGYVKRPYRITALVSTYKSASFIRECLDDLESQSVARDLEIIVVDADSPEGENAIVEEYQRRYDNIRYIRTPERIGIYPAWNLAIRAASGTYLTPMSTNDRLAPDAYERLMRALDENPAAGLAYGDSHLTKIPHQTFGNFEPIPEAEISFRWPEYTYADLVVNCRVGPHPVWRASLHRDIGYFDGRYQAISDQDFWLRIALRHPLLHIPVHTGLAWITKDSLSGQSSSYQEIRDIHDKHAVAYLARARAREAVRGYEVPKADRTVAEFPPDPESRGPELPPASLRITAIVSAFDSERFFRGCLEDLTAQTAFRKGEMEIVVVDSGSRQGEGRIAEEFRARHDRITYLRTERETIYGAWNRAVMAARGRYLVNANTDDRHRPDAFETMAEELERASAQGAGPGLLYVDALLTERENETYAAHSARRVWSLPDWNVRQSLVDCPFGCTVMWKRELHAELGFFDARLRIAGDYKFFFKAALAHGALHLPIPLTLYLENPSSLSYGSGSGVDAEVHGFLAPYRRNLPLERIYPFLDHDGSDAARAAAAVDLAACLLDPFAGRIAPADAEVRLWQALDAVGPSPEALIDLVVAAQSQGKPALASAAFTRLLTLQAGFVLTLAHRTPDQLISRLPHPLLSLLPPLIKVGETRVPIAAYHAIPDSRPVPAR